jgi:tetratricopeptide (TPR) repeat protein
LKSFISDDFLFTGLREQPLTMERIHMNGSHYPMIVKIVLFFMVGILFSSSVSGMDVNYRAQGHYYSAKQALEQKNYAAALRYIEECQKALNGTNREVQYVYVLSAYHGGRFREAKRELERFFELAEGKLQPVQFGHSVDRLTNDEIRALTMLINPIEEGIVAQERAQERETQEKARREAAARNLSGTWVWTNPPANIHSPTTLTLTQTATGIFAESIKDEHRTTRLWGGNKIREDDNAIIYQGTFHYFIAPEAEWGVDGWQNIHITYNKNAGDITFSGREGRMVRGNWGDGPWRTFVLRKQ